MRQSVPGRRGPRGRAGCQRAPRAPAPGSSGHHRDGCRGTHGANPRACRGTRGRAPTAGAPLASPSPAPGIWLASKRGSPASSIAPAKGGGGRGHAPAPGAEPAARWQDERPPGPQISGAEQGRRVCCVCRRPKDFPRPGSARTRRDSEPRLEKAGGEGGGGRMLGGPGTRVCARLSACARRRQREKPNAAASEGLRSGASSPGSV